MKGGVIILASGFASNSMLNELCIHDNSKDIDPSITEIGWHAIFSALYSPMCRLEKLELQSTRRDEDGVNDNRIASFARAMAKFWYWFQTTCYLQRLCCLYPCFV